MGSINGKLDRGKERALTVVVNFEEDTYNSFITSDNSYMGSPFYYYYMNNDLASDFVEGAIINNDAIFAACPAIVNILHAPFLEVDDLRLAKIPYDFECFGEANGVILNWQNLVISGKKPSVYRIRSTDGTNDVSFRKEKLLNKFSVYPSRPATVGGARNWRNESKLYQAPYRFFDINDFFNTPFRVIPHLCTSVEIQPFIITTISNKAVYSIGVKFYKNDPIGLENQLSTANLELPVTSSQYNQYIAENKNQIQAQHNANFLNMIRGIGQGLASKNPVTAVASVGTGMSQTEMLLAKNSDLIQAPRSVLSHGGDPYYGWMQGGSKVYASEYTLQETYARQLGDFFAKYGYKQLKVFKPNLRSRRDYNYIKTIGANIKANGIPKEQLEKLKEIYDKGVTIWHGDRNNKILDYSRDNVEV